MGVSGVAVARFAHPTSGKCAHPYVPIWRGELPGTGVIRVWGEPQLPPHISTDPLTGVNPDSMEYAR